jgi:hypothetical protein
VACNVEAKFKILLDNGGRNFPNKTGIYEGTKTKLHEIAFNVGADVNQMSRMFQICSISLEDVTNI